MSDALFQNLSTVQSDKQPTPPTIASAATIAPTTFLTFVSGTTNISQITPPVTGQHMLALAFTTTATTPQLLTTGNILKGTTTALQNRPVLLIYDPTQAKYMVVEGPTT